MFNLLKKDDIGEPPWDYNFLVNLDEKEYPKYLAKIFNYRTGEKLPLKYDFKNQAWIIDKKRCKTFNQKIQWIKLYGVTDLMRKCTDKVAVRDYVKERIGEEYLKPVLQICDSFDEIDFERLPKAFVLKCNHGSKWQYIIKDKEQFLNTPKLVEIVKQQMTGWLEQEYFPWNGFEMQYATSRRVVSHNINSGVRTRLSEGIACDSDNEASDLPERDGCQEKGIEPKILIEPLLRDEIATEPVKINVYCFNGKPKIFIKFFNNNKMSIWDENFEQIDNIFNFSEENIKMKIDDYINRTIDLSIKLAKNFDFVRVDWFIFQNKLFFEELTFTPYTGFNKLRSKKDNLKLGILTII